MLCARPVNSGVRLLCLVYLLAERCKVVARQFSIAQLFLWLFVIVLGVEIGGGLYETLVVMPLWSLSPPDSVVAYHQHNVAYPQLALNAGGRFWMFNTPALTVVAPV